MNDNRMVGTDFNTPTAPPAGYLINDGPVLFKAYGINKTDIFGTLSTANAIIRYLYAKSRQSVDLLSDFRFYFRQNFP
jgi:hypothetical protein